MLRSPGIYDVLLYTSTSLKPESYFLDHKKKRLTPIIRYANVPAERLLFKQGTSISPLFIASLMELNITASKKGAHAVDSESVLKVFDYLEPFREAVGLEETGAIGGQRAGTCQLSVDKALIRRLAQHLGFHKQMMLHLKLKAHLATYLVLENTIQEDTEI